ncbi:MAG: ABC transporter substrate-binding protein [Dehalococcoidia bacterium]
MRSALASLLLVVLIGAACTPSAQTPQQPTASSGGQAPSAPQRAADQTLRIGAAALNTLGPESVLVNFNTIQFDSLLNFGKDFVVQPGVAQTWTLQPDGLTWRFALRRDLTFGNGEKLTADDVVATFEMLFVPAPTNTVGRQLLFTTGAKKVDDYTVDITTRQRDFSLIYVSPNIFIVSKKAIEAVGGYKEFMVNPKGGGSGPYDYVEGKSTDMVVYKLRSTPHPYRKPIASEIRWRVIPDPSQRINGMRTNEIDIALTVNSPDLVDAAKREGMNVLAETDSYLNILFNKREAEQTALRDIRVRRALNYAVDKEAIARTIYRGFGTPIGQLGAPSSPMYNKNVPPIPYNLTMAKQLLAEAGYPNGITLQGIQFTNADPVAVSVMQAVHSAHRDAGINYQLVPLENTQYVAVALGQAPRMELVSAGGTNPNGIFSFSWQFLKCDQPPQIVLWCVQAMDDLLTKAYSEPDTNRRWTLLQEAMKAWADEVPMVFLVGNATFVITSAKTQGLVRTTPGYWNYDPAFRTQ